MSYQVLNESMTGYEAPIKAWVDGVQVEIEAKKQLFNMAQMPFIHSHIAVMPDVHWGMGSTVGSVIPTKRAIIPAAVGVDIGCGMMAVKTSLTANDLPDNLHAIRTAIEKAVPHGRSAGGGRGDVGAWGNVPNNIEQIDVVMKAQEDLVEIVATLKQVLCVKG